MYLTFWNIAPVYRLIVKVYENVGDPTLAEFVYRDQWSFEVRPEMSREFPITN
jgi:hypothetical protein